MERTYFLLLLLLWDNVELTLTNQVCSQLPTLEHAFVLDEYKKVQYQQGDVIYFSCDPGYITGFNVSYICTEYGWRATTHGQCYEVGTFPLRLGCLPPPTPKNGQIKFFNYFYADGDQATFQCDPNYIMTGVNFKICSNGQWTGDVQCNEVTCELPAPSPEAPVYRVPVGIRISVQCGMGGSSKQILCLPSGRWDSSCPELPCPKPPLDHFVVEEEKTAYSQNEVLRYTCRIGYRKVDERPSLCKKVGMSAQWSPPPRCELTPCGHPGEVQFADFALVQGDDYVFGSQVQYACHRGYAMIGFSTLNCLPEGWDGPPPVCEPAPDPHDCGIPPLLENGDFFFSTTEFGHNTRVLHRCQQYYTMQGGPYKTCLHGQWTGEITCLKPCMVNEALLEPNKIQFRYRPEDKLYVPHDNFLSFRCVEGATHDGAASMRQRCIDGVMVLPRCV